MLGQALNNVLVHAEDEAKQMGDEYVSVEHLFLAMIQSSESRAMKEICSGSMESPENGFLQALVHCKGQSESNQR